MSEIILSGIRPTGRLHYGNYFGAIKQFVELQERGLTCYYFVADYHFHQDGHAFAAEVIEGALVRHGLVPAASRVAPSPRAPLEGR